MRYIALAAFALTLASAPAYADTQIGLGNAQANPDQSFNNYNDVNNKDYNFEVENKSNVENKTTTTTNTLTNVETKVDTDVKTTTTTTNTNINVNKTSNKVLSVAELNQVSTLNGVNAQSFGLFANGASADSGNVSGVSVSGSGGLISSHINTGAAANVGSATSVAFQSAH